MSRFLRSHALFFVLLVVGTAMRIVVVTAYRPALMLQRDSYIYLERAVSPDVTPGAFRPALYPVLFLKPLLLGDSLRVVTVAQHLLGLAVAVVLYMLMLRLGAPHVLAALGTAPVLLDGYQLVIEHYLLAEALFQALAVAVLALLAWPDRASHGVAALAGLCIALCALTRFAGVVLIVPALTYVAARRWGWARALALSIAFVVPLVAYGMWSGSSTRPPAAASRTGFFLYGRVASFADCSRLELSSELARFCFDEPPSERGLSPGVFGLLDVNRVVRTNPDANRLLLEFSRRAIVQQPLDYAAVVSSDLLRFFEATAPLQQERYVRRWHFPRSLEDAEPHPFVARLQGSAPPSMGFERFVIDRAAVDLLRAYGERVYTYGPLLAVLLVLGLLGWLFGRGSGLAHACMLATLGALALLLLPVATTVYHFRYVLAVLPFAGPAGALGASVVLERLRERRRARS